MKTKEQKIKAVERGLESLKESETIVLADFTSLNVNDLNVFRKTLKAVEASFVVTKKRLLKIILEKAGIQFDAKKLEGQIGVLFSKKDMIETANLAHQFSSRQRDAFKILGGFDLKEKRFVDGDHVRMLGKLPSREVLLGQLVGMLAAPIRKFLYVLNEKGRLSNK